MSTVKKSSSNPRFLQFTLRGLLLLITIIAILAAVITWQSRPSRNERERQAANQRLLTAVGRGDAKATEADAASADKWTRSVALATAFRNNDMPIARLLLDTDVEFTAIVPNQRKTAVRICVESGRVEMLELLLSYRALATHHDLLAAIESEHSADLESQIIGLLLSHGVDIEAALNDVVWRYYDWPDFSRGVRLGEKLRLYGATFTPRTAAELGMLNELSDFVAEDPSIVRNRYTGRRLGAQDGDATLLGIALERADRKMVQFLLEAGAPVDLRYGRGTLLLAATFGGDPELVKLLIDRGLDPNDYEGLSPLFMAIRYYKPDVAAAIAAVLIESGANVNALGERGTTPLIEAVRRNDSRIVELLLAAGADASVTGPDGQTPYDYAQNGNNPEMVGLLK